jgi:hypothetical protein
MTIRSRSLAAGLLALSIVGWIVIVVIDIMRATHSHVLPAAPSILHGLSIGVLSTTTLCGSVWWGILLLLAHIDRRLNIVTAASAEVDRRRLTAIASMRAHLDRRFDSITNTQIEQQVQTEQETAEIRYQIAALPVARGTVHMSAAAAQPRTVSNRRRRRSASKRPGQGPSNPSTSDPVPAAYLNDMSEAVKLGQEIEAERRRRGPSSSPEA